MTRGRLGRRLLGISAVLAMVVGLLGVVAPPALAETASAVSTGHGYSCALTVSGGVLCWGANGSGQLGDGGTTRSAIPVPVVGLSSGVIAISAGGTHTCAVTSGGAVKCWGSNDYGELGDGTTFTRTLPVDVVGLASGVATVESGGNGTCALTTGGGVKCWGSPDGDGDAETDVTPTDVVGLSSGVVAIAMGGGRACALTDAGGVKCWGSGGLGDGTAHGSLVPVDVVGLQSGVASISAGDSHTCAVTTGGGVKCWGYNQFGRLGDGTQTNRRVPVDVVGLASGVVSAAAGNAHTCAVTKAGGAKCWGWNHWGRLGTGTTADSLTPVDVSHLTIGAAALSVGGHSCALTVVGGVKCWGPNRLGQLGIGTRSARYVPIGVWGLPGDPGDAYRPDGEIAVSRGRPFVGAGIYNDTGDGQGRSVDLHRGEAARFLVRVRNRSQIDDTFFLTGTHREWNFGVHYFLNGSDITDQVAGTRPLRRAYAVYTIDVAARSSIEIRLKVRVAPGAPIGDTKTVLLRAVSGGDSSRLDVVRATVTVAPRS